MKIIITISTLLSLGVLLVAKGYSVGKEVAAKDSSQIDPMPIGDNVTDTHFFTQRLTPEERLWLMNTSLIIHVQENDSNHNHVQQEIQIPASLTPKILNGQVPVDFQKRFSRWLVEEHKMTTKHFNDLINGKEACGRRVCSDLPGWGGQCCPFG